MYEAVKVALDPTPAQERRFLSHAGAARFAYNAALDHVKECIEAGEKPEWSFYSLVNWWNSHKNELAVNSDGATWWRDNSSESYIRGIESLAKGLSYWTKSRKGERKGRVEWASQSLSPRTRPLPGSHTYPAVLGSSTAILKP